MKKYYWLLAIAPLAMTASNASAQVADQDANLKAPATVEQQSGSPLLSMTELDEMRGGTQIAINNQTLNAENSGNSIGGDFTAGDVSLSDNALSGFNGLGNFVFNTGAQSTLQAGLSVTINISD
ncbi:MAG: hypothetical protein V7676_13495 [Parasphingorhabdus sp.]|uniref:hypothetical protein n=1 Tax=Parasphingorhabdus sp. TaxID=2709688 RepID=UPI003002FAED